ncbi:hypothetical protein [Luteolibacter arcticus]|nr:hypothetical protein [Luteolibacter arcticus]
MRYLWLLPVILTVASCGKKTVKAAQAVSGEYITVTEGVTALGGDLDGVLSFIIVPAEAGQVVLGRQAAGGSGFTWDGVVRFQGGKAVDFKVNSPGIGKEGTAVFGDQTFDLQKGEIFRVARDASVKQIPGSKAGRKKDPGTAKRLAEIRGD